MKDSIIVCRCEDVTVGEIREIIQDGATTPEEIKRLSRMSMGCCQGRTCGEILRQLLSQELSIPKEEIKMWETRPPAKPIFMKRC